jgi:2-hydroxy-6-oxonona-2,4-dienedioate hydrolase
MQTTSGRLDLGNGTLYYETAGAGEPLVLAHAAFLDSRMFDAQWATLVQQFRVIRYDMLGYGQSDPVPGPLCRRENLRRLLDHLKVGQAHFVGCSNGGAIALDLILEEPERALSLTMVGSTPSGFELRGDPPQEIPAMFEAFQRGDFVQASELQIRLWFDGLSRQPGDVNPDLRGQALAMNRIPVERQTFLVADVQPVRPLDPPALTRLDAVHCPTLVAVGALDHAEVVRAADVLADGVPNARKVVIEQSGHVPSFERPDVFTPLLLDFLRDPQLTPRA